MTETVPKHSSHYYRLNPLTLQTDFKELWAEADAIWDQRSEDGPFSGYVSADYPAILRVLQELKPQVQTFLEWGSGLGVVAIMASQLGFDAYGIEVEPELVEAAVGLASRFDLKPTFGVGSFVPDGFRTRADLDDVFHNTVEGHPDAYEAIDMELRDFDLVYAYPWPEEHAVFKTIVRKFGSPHTQFLSYDAREGLELSTPGAKQRRSAKR